MTIEAFIRKVCVQDAVYWAKPTSDGYGNLIFGLPRAIKVRWDDSVNQIHTTDNTKLSNQAAILVPVDLVLGGFVWLGSLDELPGGLRVNPMEVDGVWEIQTFQRVPMIRSDKVFVRKAFLTQKKW